MNTLQKASLAILLFTSFSTFASSITTFVSGFDDGCTSCTLSTRDDPNYVVPTGTDLDGASWVQASDAWNLNTDYSVYEMDLSLSTMGSILTSLFVSYDDNLLITIGSSVLFDSVTSGVSGTWGSIIDVFDYTSSIYIEAGETLTFYVNNNGLGATGAIWKGTTSVPEPSMVILLSFGLIGFGLKRRNKI